MQIEQSSAQLKRNYFWNTLASAMNALSSALFVLVIARVLGVYEAGLFSIAFALSQQFQVIGHFEIRSFQATDTGERFSFAAYLGARYFSCLIMLLCVAGYTFCDNGFTGEAITVALIVIMKVFDAFEDVFHGMFQQHGRLDLAGRAFFFRLLAQLAVFCLCAVCTGNLTVSCLAACIVSFAVFFFANIPYARRFAAPVPSFALRPMAGIFWACLPLFVGSFLLVYLTNAPRYAIDLYLSREAQAVYAILFMPSLVINLLSGFVFKPLLTEMAVTFTQRNLTRFRSIVGKGIFSVTAAAAVTLIVARLWGVELLGALYGTDLGRYQAELLILLLGGLFNALGIIFYYAIVTMRRQKYIFPVYAAAAAFAYFFRGIVKSRGMFGAAVLYDASMLIVFLLFFVIASFGLAHSARRAQIT